MLIFILVTILVVISFLLAKWHIGCDFFQDIFYPLCFITGIVALLFMSIAVGINHCTADADLIKLQERYESLTYQVDNQMYNNNNEVGKKELVDQIVEWNENLAFSKTVKHNLWVNWFIAVDYDKLEYIPISKVK